MIAQSFGHSLVRARWLDSRTLPAGNIRVRAGRRGLNIIESKRVDVHFAENQVRVLRVVVVTIQRVSAWPTSQCVAGPITGLEVTRAAVEVAECHGAGVCGVFGFGRFAKSQLRGDHACHL